MIHLSKNEDSIGEQDCVRATAKSVQPWKNLATHALRISIIHTRLFYPLSKRSMPTVFKRWSQVFIQVTHFGTYPEPISTTMNASSALAPGKYKIECNTFSSSRSPILDTCSSRIFFIDSKVLIPA